MTQYFADNGEIIPCTVLKVSPMQVVQVKSKDGKDGYNSVQVLIPKKISGSKNFSKAVKGHIKTVKPGKLLEFRVDDSSAYQVGQMIDVSGFQIGEIVDVIGTMKGRGFAGAIKRHGFAGFPASHGHDKPRSVGSIGQRYPQHTRKGLRMSGHMGTTQVTVKNLQIVEVDTQKGLISVRGAVPGTRNGLVKVISNGKVKPLVKVEVIKDEKKKK